MDNEEIKVRPFFVTCAIIELIAVGLLIAAVFIMTLVSKYYKKEIKNWYEAHILEDTSVTEVIEGRDSYEI